MSSFAQGAAMAPDERIESIDVVRGIALFGVLIVNLVTGFRVSIFQQFLDASSEESSADALVDRILSVGFEGKALCLFALLFGVGLAIQHDRLSRRGSPLYWLSRRLIVLLGFGLVHLFLVWNGDILTEYALAGLLTLPLLLLPTRALPLAIATFLALYAAGFTLYSSLWPSTATLQQDVALANQVYSSGNLADIWRFFLQEFPLILALHVFIFPRTIALFLLGALLWRSGILKRPHEFGTYFVIAAIAGIVGGVASDSAALLALGYGAAIMALMQLRATRRILSAFAPIGRMAFTNYLLQSLIFGFIFFGYGLGQFGRMSAATAFVLGAAVYMAQMVLSTVWLRHFRFGPVEWLWRTLMYGATQPMRKNLYPVPLRR
jgi:uncharacterized protein